MAKKIVRLQKASKQSKKLKGPKAVAKQMGSLEKFRRMATVIQDSNDAITFQDLDGNILAWNRGAEQIYGYSEAEALSMNIVDTVPKEYQEEARGFLASLKRGEILPNLETKRKTKDGRIVDVWLTNTKLTDDKGKLTGIATTERDITEQTKTLEKFRRMATVIQDSNDAITFQDLDGNILAWNQGAEQIYGYSEAEALSMNIVDTVPKEYQEEAREFLSSLKRGELVPTLETKRKTKDGRIVDVWLTNTKLTDDKGKLTGIATTERDISERIGSLEKFRRMATVIQDSNDAITFQDLEGNILAWNRGAEIIYGYSQAEALSMNIVDTVPKEYQEEARGFLASLKRGELLPNLETKRKHKDGRIIDVWLTNTKLTDGKGKLTGIATTERDITERKHAEASLREKARELEFLREGQITLSDKMRGEQDVSRLGQSVLSHIAPFLNAQRGAFYCLTEEKTFKRVSGYAYSKLDAREKTIALGEGLVGQAALGKKPILLENLPQNYFGRISSDLGQSAPSSLLLAPVFYEGEVNGVIELASFASFSEHQRTFLEHVSENIGIAINTSIARKKQEEILGISQGLTEELQSQQEELKSTNDVLEEQSRALQESQTQLQSQQSELEQTNEVLGQQRDILNEKNEALNKAQTLLEERSNEVQRASQYKSEFLANMSHELRTPLNSSLILSKLLADNVGGNLTQEQIQYAQSINSAGNDLLNLINDILDLSKVEAGKLEIRPESVFLPNFLSSLRKTFDPLAREKKLIFKVQSEPGVPETILTDRQRLEQILKNLLSNAFKFTEKGEVTLHVSRSPDGRLALSVTDTGIGVEKAQHEVIFEAFRQADGTTNRKYGGTDLGLSIAKQLVEMMGGKIGFRSKVGEGSTFWFTAIFDIPSARAKASSEEDTRLDAAHGRAVPPHGLSRARQGARILVAEDGRTSQRVLLGLLEKLGYLASAVANGAEAVHALRQEKYDLVLMDCQMPEMDGFEATRRIRAHEKAFGLRPVSVVALTANAIRGDRERCLEAGMDDYLPKPFRSAELRAMVERHLRRDSNPR